MAKRKRQPPPGIEIDTEEITDNKIMGLLPRNMEQAQALEALLNPEIDIVTLIGKAGSGKTLIAVAAGLHYVTQGIQYDRVIVSRPVVPMGSDIGFLPGDLEEKLAPWTQPIFDSIEVLANLCNVPYREFLRKGQLEVEALMYIRGRSIPSQYMIIDEAQNLTSHEIKTVITRAGEGTKVVLTGDPAQIDKKGLTATNNGLVYAATKFAGQKIAAHFELQDCVRSRLAKLGAELL